MAKKKIDTYIFNPGVSALDNLFPNSYYLIEQNKDFIEEEAVNWIANRVVLDTAINLNPIAVDLLENNLNYIKKETIAYITNQIANAAPDSIYDGYTYDSNEVEEDVGNNIEAITKDLKYGGNERSRYVQSLYWNDDISQIDGDGQVEVDIYVWIEDLITNYIFTNTPYVSLQIQASQYTSGSAAETTATSKTSSILSSLRNVIENGLSFLPTLAYGATFAEYTYNREKCKRDVKYVLDAYLYDLRYGGNYETWGVVSKYWVGNIPQIDGTRKPEIETHDFIRSLINNYIITNETYTSLQDPITVFQTTNTEYVAENGVSGTKYTPTDATYDPTTGQLILTIVNHEFSAGDKIDIKENSLVFTCSLDGDATEHPYPRASDSNAPGGADYVYSFPVEIISVSSNTITVNVGISSNTSDHTFIRAETDAIQSANDGIINELYTLLATVIENGLDARPERVSGLGYLRVQGRIREDDLLIITNVSKGEIIYTFNDPTKLAVCEFLKDYEGADNDFPSFDQTTDTITNIHLFADTSTHSSTDRIQIFVEEKELKVRPFDFGTDAIERNRVANAQSMLDADFEYGLQPTKWQAIGMLRGYPGIYEIPGTEIPVITVATDASVTTEGIGQSIITVSCSAPHDLEAGEPFTIKGLGGTALGIGRAEGSFVVYQKVDNTTFTYFAKSKVGISDGEVLSTTYTQLRKAGFYTGAPIGTPDFQVLSQGSAGTMTIALDVQAGQDTIPFSGDAPELGAPLIDTSGAIPLGAQVTAINGSGGIQTSADLTQDVFVGDQQIQVDDVTGITVGLAIDSGDGSSTIVTNIQNNDITLSDPLTANRVGSDVEYVEIPAGLITSLEGINATFDVVRSGGIYTGVTVNTGGSGYNENDSLIIQGSQLGGVDEANNIFIRVSSVDGFGSITGITFEGIAAPADGVFNGITGQLQAGLGTGAVFDVNGLNNNYTVTLGSLQFNDLVAPINLFAGTGAIVDVSYLDNTYSVIINQAGSGYEVGQRLLIPGSDFVGGLSPTNDIIIEIISVDVNGGLVNITASGTAPDGSNIYPGPAYTYNGLGGSNAEFTVERNGTTYSIPNIPNGGTGYNVGETFDISGADLGGSSPANDAVITIDTVDGGTGAILTVSITGIALNYGEQNNNLPSILQGSGAIFNVSKNNTTWSATIVNGGSDYTINDQVTLELAPFGIETPTYDVIITVTNVDGSGAITAISVAGTSPDPGGQNYFVNDRIIIPGTSINSGLSPDNDVTIDVLSVGGNGEILTFNYVGAAPDATNSFTDVPYSTAGNGVDTVIDVQTQGSSYVFTIATPGTDFAIGDQIVITGNNLGGATPGNDLIITVSDVGNNGEILDANSSGTARNGFSDLNNSGDIVVGSGATFDIGNSSQVYSVNISSPGSGYIEGQEILVLGNTIGGVTPTNDLTITIDAIDIDGGITTVSISGTGGDGTGNYTGISGNNAPLSGQSSTFNVQRSGGTYTVNVSSSGSGYYIGNQLLIQGTQLGGSSPANDLLITITDVDDPYTGGITSVTSAGTPTASSAINFFSTVTFSEFTTTTLLTGNTVDFRALATIKVVFESPHGLVPGDTFITTISTDDGITDGSGNNHKLAAGSYIATKVPDLNSLEFQARAAGTLDTATTEIEGILYARADSFFVHRPYDGGVQLGTGGPQHGAQAIRQSKNYIRYQSGKGIMYTTGALFAPSYDLLTVSANGTEVGSAITLETDDSDHGLQVGGIVEIIGVITPGYNGIYQVSDIISERKFRVLATSTLGSTIPQLGSTSQISTKEWHGAIVRAGAYDEQNGIFWQYDGQNLAVTQRSATFQLAGLASIDPEDNTLYGQNCRWLDQCSAGDRIVIRGMTHVITQITDNNTMTVTPDYRGVRRAENAKICLITDKTVIQENFNLDPVNGSGKSGYDVDISKMQMIGIQYSWYGAGFIDYMLRGADGNFIFCHRMRNSNVNTEAFMRSGNLPVRYEVTNEGPNGKLAETINDSQTTIPLVDASMFPQNGATIYIDNEIITYTGVSGNDLTGCNRGTFLTNYQAGAQRQYSAGGPAPHEARTGVIIISNTVTPIISHWGSAFITDGGFDEDRGYIFSYAATGLTISTTRNTAFLLRLAPSVSNAITGDLGDRELLNRAQLLLNGIEVTSDPLGTDDTGGIVVEGILNPSNYPEAVNDVSWGALSGLSEGGQPSFAQIAPGAGINWDVGAATTADGQTISTAIDVAGFDVIRADRDRSFFLVPSSENLNLAIGSVVSGENNRGQPIFRSGTAITGVVRNSGTEYDGSGQVTVDRFNISRSVQNSTAWWRPANISTTLARVTPTSGNGNLVAYFDASFLTTGVSTGISIDSAETAFPPNTIVSQIESRLHGTTQFYEVTFNNPSLSAFTAGELITFNLSGAAYAQPGETIFKFIAVPGERSELDLSPIKELTNTSLGGRGTFPNGPDVLSINIYKTSGNDITGNVILKWGEAQA